MNPAEIARQIAEQGGNASALPLPFHNGEPTSRAAAESVRESADSMRARILAYIKAGPPEIGATCDEMEETLGYRHQTASARIRELYLAGRIRKSGKTRATRSGRQAVVWVAADD